MGGNTECCRNREGEELSVTAVTTLLTDPRPRLQPQVEDKEDDDAQVQLAAQQTFLGCKRGKERPSLQ